MKKGDLVLYVDGSSNTWKIGIFEGQWTSCNEVWIGHKRTMYLAFGAVIPFKGNEGLLFTKVKG